MPQALFAALGALAFGAHGLAHAQSFGPAGAIGPTIVELGQSRDGGATYVAHGYAPAAAAIVSLAGLVSGEFSFRVGGYCLDGSDASLVPTGVSGNTTAWAYNLTTVSVSLVEDAPKGSCNYTVRLTYTLSLTGAVSINQMAYTVYLRGHGAPAASAGGLTAIR
jgi:hypothetical protein